MDSACFWLCIPVRVVQFRRETGLISNLLISVNMQRPSLPENPQLCLLETSYGKHPESNGRETSAVR